MLAGKVIAALKRLTTELDNGLHEANDEIITELTEKHPKHAPIQDNTLLYGPIENLLPTYFDSIDEGTVFKEGCLTKGTCPPSDQFRHI